MANKQISKVTLGGVTYDIKDEAARARLTALEGIASGGVSIKVVEELPTPGDDTLGIIYFKKKTLADKEGDIFDEYLTVKVTEGSQEVAKWEHIGSTAIDLSEYVTKEHHHRIKGQIDLPLYSGTPRGTVSLPELRANLTTTKKKILAIPEGHIGEPYTLTGADYSKEDDIKDTFAREALRAEYLDSTETLVFEEAPSAQAVTSVGETHLTFPTLTGELPYTQQVEIITGAEVTPSYYGEAEFTGTNTIFSPEKFRVTFDTETSGFALFGGGVSNDQDSHL